MSGEKVARAQQGEIYLSNSLRVVPFSDGLFPLGVSSYYGVFSEEELKEIETRIDTDVIDHGNNGFFLVPFLSDEIKKRLDFS